MFTADTFGITSEPEIAFEKSVSDELALADRTARWLSAAIGNINKV